MGHGSPLANTFPLAERKLNVGSLGKSIAKVDFWTTHDAPWSHGSQITDAGNSPPRVRKGPHASALGGGLGLWVPTNFASAHVVHVQIVHVQDVHNYVFVRVMIVLSRVHGRVSRLCVFFPHGF